MLAISPTYFDFKDYFGRAKKLQAMNEGLIPRESVGDELMDNVHIYDCVERRMAGFSKVLEDLHGTRSVKENVRLRPVKLPEKEFHFIHLFHRYTGSGASFYPRIINGHINPDEHGYFNSHCGYLAQIGNVNDMREYIVGCEEAMCTSLGNQGPSLKNPFPDKYRLSVQYYFDVHAESFIEDYLEFINKKQRGIKEAVDFSLDWHSDRGMKRWKFILTAFVMDDAEYYPSKVNPDSDVYMGSTAIQTLKMIYPRIKNSEHDQGMRALCNVLKSQPYSLEDVQCDFVRYVNNFIPKGYDRHFKRNKLRTEQ